MTLPLSRLLPVALMLLASACTQNQQRPTITAQRPPESANAALQALDDGLYDEAGKRFAQILANNPDHVEARLGMAEVHLAQGRPNEALALFTTLTDDPIMGPQAQQGRGLALLAQGRTPQAALALRQATDKSDVLWRAWNAQGRLADAEGRWADADRCYAKALAAYPRSAAVLNNMGYSLLLRGKPAEAERRFREALTVESQSKVIAANLRMAVAWQGRYADATSGVRPEELAPVLNDVGYVALARGDLDAAQVYLERAQALNPRFLPQTDANLTALHAAREGRGARPLQ